MTLCLEIACSGSLYRNTRSQLLQHCSSLFLTILILDHPLHSVTCFQQLAYRSRRSNRPVPFSPFLPSRHLPALHRSLARFQGVERILSTMVVLGRRMLHRQLLVGCPVHQIRFRPLLEYGFGRRGVVICTRRGVQKAALACDNRVSVSLSSHPQP